MKKSKGFLVSDRKRRAGFLAFCVLPSVILYVLFMIYPALNVFTTSVYNWSGLSPVKQFVGMQNFVTLFHDDKFWTSFTNTIFLMLVVTVATMALALFFAYSLTQSRLREKNLYRVLFFFPNVLSIVVIGTLFSNIYTPNTGIVNNFLRAVGLDSWCHAWLGEKETVLWAVAIAMIWQAVGYYMVMYLAGMDSISPELYEAADIEGASSWCKFRRITMPLMWEIVRITLVFFIVSTMNMSFLFVTVMTAGGPNGSSEVLLSYMYKQAFTYANFGYAMAIAVVIFLFSMVLALVLNRLTREKN